MGLFDDFDIDMDDVEAATGFAKIPDDYYEWEISEALRQNGSKNKPDDTFFIIKYNLDEAGTYWEWFTLAVDGDSQHTNAKRSLGYLKERLLALGVPASELNSIEPEDLEGITGTFQLVTTKGKDNKEYQNIRNFKANVDEAEAEEETEEPEESDAAIKKRVAAKRAAREEKAAPAKKAPARSRRSAPADDEDNDNPFG